MAWVWMLVRPVMLGLLFVVYLTINSEGTRMVAPFFAQKLWKFPLPFFHRLRDFEGWQRVDCAHVFCVLLYFISVVAVIKLVHALYVGAFGRTDGATSRVERYQAYTAIVSTAVVAIDCILFYFGCCSRSLFDPGLLSLKALMLTLGYGIILLSVGLWFDVQHQD